MTIFDIECMALADAELERIKPQFRAPANYKDESKIAAHIAEQEQEWKAKAALSPLTGRIVLIGLLKDKVQFIQADTEAALLEMFWREWKKGERMVGFSIKSFDLPFLFRRSVINRVPVPNDLFEGRYFNFRAVCLQERWCCYSSRTEGQSLDAVCKACGLPGKNGTGADFPLLWLTDRNKAMDYCGLDLECIASLAELLGVRDDRPPF